MADQHKRSMVKNTGIILLSEGKNIRIRAHGYSMYPSIRPGAMVIIEPIQVKGAPVPGEIIAIETDTGLIIHRLIKIVVRDNTRLFVARGDSNPFSDNPVKISRIAGRVTGAETTAENTRKADLRINPKPHYITNRLRVIVLQLWKKLGRLNRQQ